MAGYEDQVKLRAVALSCENAIRSDPANLRNYLALYTICTNLDDTAYNWGVTDALKGFCAERLKGPVEDREEIGKIFRNTLLLEAQGLRFDSYMQYIELLREPEKRFWLPRRKQLLPVCNAMQRLVDGELDILSVSLPPGTGKSTLEIFLHSMSIGAFPDQPSLASGHSGTLTNSIYNGVLGIITDRDEYLWRDVFPNAGDIITNAKEQTIDVGKKHRFSSLTCRAIGASLTGATRCEKLLTADDLVSGIEEALSVDRLEKLWQAYTNDLKSRKKLDCKELHLATRWSVHDPIGRLRAMYDGNPRAMFLVIPAVDDEGNSNFNYQYRLGFDEKYFADMRDNLDEASYLALFQNEPIEREGLLYDRDTLRRYFDLPSAEPDAVLAVCDTKDKGSDYCVMPILYQYGPDFYIEDIVCDNALPELVEEKLIATLIRHKVKMARFESNSAGGKIAEKVQDEVKKRGGFTHITTKYSTANKETRIIVDSPFVKEHFLFPDDTKLQDRPEYRKALQMLCSYTVAGKNPHDDVPDAFSMAADFIQSFTLKEVQIMQRPF